MEFLTFYAWEMEVRIRNVLWRRIIGMEVKERNKSMYNLNMSVPTSCYCLTVVFLNAQVLWKYILFQFCNVFHSSLYHGNCVASKGLCCPVSATDRKLVLSVNKEPLLLT